MEPSLRSTATLGSDAPSTAPSAPLAAGILLANRYEVRGCLGFGGYAFVYRAFDRELRQDVALKLLRPERVTDTTLARLRREAAIAREAQSARLLRVFDIESAGETTFLAVELVEGGSLRERLQEGRLGIEEALRVAVQVLEALAALHELGIVHRDVKPGNILLTRDGDVKLADFGLARHLDGDETRMTATEAVLGTFDYLAPEQVLGKEPELKSDLYSFGVVLYEMLTGRLPFAKTSSLEVLLAHLREPIVPVRRPRPDAPRWLAAVVRRLLEKDPRDRYPSARAALADLSRRRAGPRPRLRRVALGWTLAGLAAAVLAAGIMRQQGAAPRFSHLAVGEQGQGLVARGERGEVLWRLPGVEGEIAGRAVLARLRSGERPVLAFVLHSEQDLRPEVILTLSFVDPVSGRVVRRARLPSSANQFPQFSDYYRPDMFTAIDIDGDGVDEILVTYSHSPYWPSFTVLYEPSIDRARTLFVGSGHHRFAGAQDLDGDGRVEVLLGGINNALGYVNALTALRIEPWIGEHPSEAAPERVESPDRVATGDQAMLHWYALLPRGLISRWDRACAVDPARHRLSVTLLDGRRIELGFDGLPVGLPARVAAERAAARRQAFAHLRETRRLLAAHYDEEALAQAREAVAAARRVGEPILLETMERLAAKTLVSVGRLTEADALFGRLVESSAAAPEIAFDAAEAFHLHGDLGRAVRWYARGMGPGGEARPGKTKYDLMEGMVLAFAEQEKWQEALAAVERYRRAYGDMEGETSAIAREWVRWRQGEKPARPEVAAHFNWPDVQRYYYLELRCALGDEPAALLRDIETELARASLTRGEVLSLRAELLARLGRRAEALVVGEQALARLAAERSWRTTARGHYTFVLQRLQALRRTS